MYKYITISNHTVVSAQESAIEINSPSLVLVDELPEIGSKYENGVFTAPVPPSIRIISTGAMQRRFTAYEEIAIKQNELTDVIRGRLFNSGHCDLDFQELKDGLAVIVNMLTSAPDPFNANQMLVADFTTRYDELLANGTQDEAY